MIEEIYALTYEQLVAVIDIVCERRLKGVQDDKAWYRDLAIKAINLNDKSNKLGKDCIERLRQALNLTSSSRD